jgi:hypothetical protein
MRAVPSVTLWNAGVQNQIRNDYTGAVIAAAYTGANVLSTGRIGTLSFSGSPVVVNGSYSFDLQLDARL